MKYWWAQSVKLNNSKLQQLQAKCLTKAITQITQKKSDHKSQFATAVNGEVLSSSPGPSTTKLCHKPSDWVSIHSTLPSSTVWLGVALVKIYNPVAAYVLYLRFYNSDLPALFPRHVILLLTEIYTIWYVLINLVELWSVICSLLSSNTMFIDYQTFLLLTKCYTSQHNS